jgi:hypothetical protein
MFPVSMPFWQELGCSGAGDCSHGMVTPLRLLIPQSGGVRLPESYYLMALEGRCPMLWTIFVILLVLWILGMVSSYTLGGFIHVLLVLAIVVVLIRVIQGRRPI